MDNILVKYEKLKSTFSDVMLTDFSGYDMYNFTVKVPNSHLEITLTRKGNMSISGWISPEDSFTELAEKSMTDRMLQMVGVSSYSSVEGYLEHNSLRPEMLKALERNLVLLDRTQIKSLIQNKLERLGVEL